MQKRTSRAPVACLSVLGGVGCLGLIGLFVLVGIFHSATSEVSPPSSTTPETKSERGAQWTYRNDVDTMGRKESLAYVKSTNTLSFDFPYQGIQHGILLVRKSSYRGTNVAVQIERGQFLCGIRDCTVDVRFDNGPIQRFSAAEPSDHSTTTLFINNEPRFISQLRKAKLVRVEATFFQEGTQALVFNVEAFRSQ